MKLSSQVVLYTPKVKASILYALTMPDPSLGPRLKFYRPPGNLLWTVLPISGWEAWAFSQVSLSGTDMLLSYLLSSFPLDTSLVRSSGISDLI